MLTKSLGIVDVDAFREAVSSARRGQEIRTVTMKRTLEIEFWLREVLNSGSPDFRSSIANHESASRQAGGVGGEPCSQQKFSQLAV